MTMHAPNNLKTGWIELLLDHNMITPQEVKDLSERRLCVTFSEANYGTPSAAIIEFEGSPARCSMIICDIKPTASWIVFKGKMKYKSNPENGAFLSSAARHLIASTFDDVDFGPSWYK
jgi:hypothetical protein